MRYDGRADPVIGTVRDGRPCYVRQRVIDELIAARGWRRIVRLGAKVTALETTGGAWVRPIEPWGDVAALERAAAFWTDRGLRAPSTPAGLATHAAPGWYRGLAWSLAAPLWGAVRGGWQETQVRGRIDGGWRAWDIRRAYRWALTTLPLPEREGMRIATAWNPRRPGLHCVTIAPVAGAPWPLRDGGTVLVETPHDPEHYGAIEVREYHGGVWWRGWIDAAELGATVDATGVPRVQRTYWGPWASRTPTVTTWASGKVVTLPPLGGDPVRAHLITARVRDRLAGIAAPYRYVDAVLAPANVTPEPQGERPGDWRLVREYPRGIWIGWPGAYGPADGPPDRLSGTRRAA